MYYSRFLSTLLRTQARRATAPISFKFGTNRFEMTSSTASVKYLNQEEAVALDQELFSQYEFSVAQLMELAGQGCAHALAEKYPTSSHPRVLVVCGPGNNGGDGFVCARHLVLLGYQASLFWVQHKDNSLYQSLYVQCQKSDVQIIEQMPSLDSINKDYSVVVDAVFGFSFRPPVRQAYQPVLRALAETTVPVLSIDVPSGWHVEEGPTGEGPHLTSHTLVSLTAPKLCARHFKGKHHVLAGRFVPKQLSAKYELNLPRYPGLSLTVDLA